MVYNEQTRYFNSQDRHEKLSSTELEILALIRQGLTSSEIALRRNCSTRTVEKHRSNMIKKLNLKSSQHALLLWMQHNQHIFNT